MQRDIFLKLVRKLEEHCQTILIGSDIDYRRLIAERCIDQVKDGVLCFLILLNGKVHKRTTSASYFSDCDVKHYKIQSKLLYSVMIFYHMVVEMSTMQVQAHFFWPLDGNAQKEFQRVWHEITSKSGGQITSTTLGVMFGRYFICLSSSTSIV